MEPRLTQQFIHVSALRPMPRDCWTQPRLRTSYFRPEAGTRTAGGMSRRIQQEAMYPRPEADTGRWKYGGSIAIMRPSIESQF